MITKLALEKARALNAKQYNVYMAHWRRDQDHKLETTLWVRKASDDMARLVARLERRLAAGR